MNTKAMTSLARKLFAAMRGRIVDARGKTFRICHYRELPKPAKAARIAVQWAHVYGFREIAVVLVAGGLVTAPFFLLPVVRAADFTRLVQMLAAYVVLYLCYIAVASAVATLIRGRLLNRAIAACVAEGHCPACAYQLPSPPPVSDVPIVCPECGAAWRPVAAP